MTGGRRRRIRTVGFAASLIFAVHRPDWTFSGKLCKVTQRCQGADERTLPGTVSVRSTRRGVEQLGSSLGS